MPDIIELYELFLQIIEPKRYSQSSIKTYKSILMPFLPHVNGEDMEKLSENDIWDWMLKKLKVRGFPYASVKPMPRPSGFLQRTLSEPQLNPL